MLIKPNWEIFKAKFSENPQDNFEWFCYLLFSKEYHQPYGIHRYKNQSGIETDPIEVGDEVIGWQSKFYGVPKVATLNKDLKETLRKVKRDYPNITKIVFYTNMELTQYHKDKNTKAEKTVAHKEIEELFEKEKIELVLRMDSYFESSFVCQEQKNISRYFFKLDVKWELTPYGFLDTIKSKYESDFQTISLLTNDKKPIDDIFVNLAIVKDEKEKDEKEKEEEKEPIEIKELVHKSNKSLIYGKAGIGKTTLCKYMSYKWAKGELYSEFEYVIYIPLREWKSNSGIKGAIRDYYYSLDEKTISIDFYSNKTLFLFDGYDELDSDKKKNLRDELEKYTLTHYLITTRPYGYQKSDFRVDKYFETIGFTDEDVEKYIDAFFKGNNDKAKFLKAYLETNINIKQIGTIPLILEMICSQWKQKEFSDSLTMTKLYTKSIENIFFEYTEKNGTAYIQDKDEEIFNYLGKIAFEGLKQQTIVLDKKIIKEKRSFFSEYVLKAGFLNDGKAEKSNPLLNSYQFPHLTFQEYFSALYVSKLSKEEQREIIRDWKFYPHMQMFFAFLGGLIVDKEFFLGEIESEPRDLVGMYEFDLISLCLGEIRLSDNQRYMEKMIQWIEYLITDEKLFENLFIPLLKRVEVNKVFHNQEIAESVYNLILKYSKSEFQIHNFIVTIVDKLSYLLPIVLKYEIELCKKYSEIVNNQEISIYAKSAMARGFAILVNTKDINGKLIELIKSESEDVNYRCWLSKALIELKPNSIESVDVVILFLKDNYKNLDNEPLERLCKSFERISQKETLVVKLEAILDYSQSDNYNLEELKDTLHNLKARISLNDNRTTKNRFQIYHVSKKKAYYLIHQKEINIAYEEEQYIDDLISIVRDVSLDTYMWRRGALVTLESLGRFDDKILNLAIDYLNSEKHDLKGEAIRLFFSIDRDDSVYLSILEKAIDDFNKFLDKYTIWQKLFSIKRQDEEFIDILMKYANSVSSEIIKKSVLVKSFSSFKKVYSIIVSDMKSEFFGTKIDIKILFQAYDISYNVENYIISNVIYSKKPLYIKNNKLYTIENGKEIHTQRALTTKEIERLTTIQNKIKKETL